MATRDGNWDGKVRMVHRRWMIKTITRSINIVIVAFSFGAADNVNDSVITRVVVPE